VSITKISGLGSATICLLLLAVIGFSYSHIRNTNDVLEANISIATPARDTLKQVDRLIADSAFQLLQYINRDPVVAADVLDLLNRLVASEKSLIAVVSPTRVGSGLKAHHAIRARTVFYSFLDEQENDPASDTSIALKTRIANELTNLRNSLSHVAKSVPERQRVFSEFRLLSNFLASTEAVLERFFNRSAVRITDVLSPVERSLTLLRKTQSGFGGPDSHADHGHKDHRILTRLDLRQVVETVLTPIARYRASLFTFSDSVDASMDGTSLKLARVATELAMHSARHKIAQVTRKMDIVFGEYQSDSIAEGQRDQRIFIFIACIGIVAAIFVTLLVQRRITTRLTIVSDGARRISGGDLQSRIEITESDGLGELAGEFNSMADALLARNRQITDTQHELENLNRDLEHRVEARSAQLRDSEQRLDQLVESTHEGFWFIGLDGKTTDVNPAMCRMLGRPAEEIIGKTIYNFVDANNKKAFHEQIAKRKAGEASAYEIALRRPDGSNIPCLNNATPLFTSEGEMIGSVGIWSDISEIKETHRILKIEKERADESSKAKSQFLATMSHEIRTPMNGVLGMANLLIRTRLDTKQQHFAERIKRSGEALLDLLNDILDISKSEAGRVELDLADFELPRLLLEVDALMQSKARGKGLDYVTDIAPGTPMLFKGDLGRIKQILFNLVGNAVKFTTSGHIEISVSHRPLGGDFCKLRFEVNDTGLGIEEDKLDKIFEKFSQADASTTREYGGTGLGLAICRDLVQLKGGEIGIESAPGKGTTFWFDLTCEISRTNSAPVAPREVAPPPPAENAAARPFRILLAEDNPVNQEVAVAVLEDGGHQVTVVENGADAVTEVQNASYDIVLMDMQMPVMDGITATMAIRGLAGGVSRIPIVALTANAMVGDREKYLVSGMNDYVSKPFDPDELLATIRQWVDGGAGDDAPVLVQGTGQAGDDVGAAVLDPSIVEPLRNAKPEFWKRLVGVYMDTTPANLEKLEKLEHALAEADCPAVRMVAHTMKSSSANMGTMRLSDLCRRLEAAAVEERLETGAALFADLRREFDSVAAALARDREPDPSVERSVV